MSVMGRVGTKRRWKTVWSHVAVKHGILLLYNYQVPEKMRVVCANRNYRRGVHLLNGMHSSTWFCH